MSVSQRHSGIFTSNTDGRGHKYTISVYTMHTLLSLPSIPTGVGMIPEQKYVSGISATLLHTHVYTCCLDAVSIYAN